MIKCEKDTGYIKGNLNECVVEWGVLAIVLMEEMIRLGQSVRDAKLTLLGMLGDSMDLLEKK